MNIEHFGVTLPEFKEISEEGEFEGYAAIFGEADAQNDIFKAGAFKKTIKAKKPGQIKLLRDHQRDKLVGIWTELKEDSRGLYVKGRFVLETTLGAETHMLVKAGALDGLSVGFVTVKSQRDERTGVRTILEADLWEISAVAFPAQAKAKVSAVKSIGIKEDLRRCIQNLSPIQQTKAILTSTINRLGAN